MILRVLAAIVIVAAAVAAWLLLSARQTSVSPPPPAARTSPAPGFVAQTARLVETGPNGLPLYTLDAATISQEPGSQVVSLENVQMSFRDPSGRDWHGRADHGLILNDAAMIDLTGSVVVTGPLSGPQPAATITSEHLAVDTRTEIITTQSPVFLEWSGQRLSGRGLTARLKTEYVTLESDVHGQFSP